MRRFLAVALAWTACTTTEAPVEEDPTPVPWAPGDPPPELAAPAELDLPDGTVGEAYDDVVGWVDAPGTPMWTLHGGSLPQGLSLRSDGHIVGVPLVSGPSAFEVVVSVPGYLPAHAARELFVRPPPEEFLGLVRDQRNNLEFLPTPMHPEGLLSAAWVRAAGGGEPGMDSVLLRPARFRPGPDGIAQGGLLDDEFVGDLDPALVSAVLEDWNPRENASPEWGEDEHLPEGSPPTMVGLLLVAGADSGRATLRLSALGWGELDVHADVVPPDWCPTGLHPDGGWGPGCCVIEDCPEALQP
jgi:hypothetical protein